MRAVTAHAKVNLALDVIGRRPDGFHELVTVVAAIDWHDLVCVELRRGTGRTSISVEGPDATESMAASGELLDRAAAVVRALAAPELGDATASRLDVRITVDKRIPVAAGLGGGSADAAAVLRAAVAELGVPATSAQLAAAAAELGSDVPAVLAGGVAVARGRGERLQPIPRAPRLHLAVAVAGACSTAAVYAQLTDAERRDSGRAARMAAALATGETPDRADFGSALEPAARRVSLSLATALDSLREATGLTWPLTGSGGAAFEPAPSAAAADEAVTAARRLGLAARVCRTLTLSQGPPSPPITIAP